MEDIVDTNPVPAVEESEILDAKMMGSDPPELTASVVSGRVDGPCVWSLTEELQVSNMQKNWRRMIEQNGWFLYSMIGSIYFEMTSWLGRMCDRMDVDLFLAGVLERLRTDPRLEIIELDKIEEPPVSLKLQLKMTSLDLAILMGDLKMVKTFVGKNSLPKPTIKTVTYDDPVGFFNTPLHWAVVGGNIDIVDVLLEKDKNVNVTNWVTQTPLDVACKLEHVEILQKLIVHDRKGRDPLHIAVESGDLDFMKKLPCNFNATDFERRTPLHYLASARHFQTTEIIKYFAEEKTLDTKALDHKKCSAIYVAVLHCNTKVVQALLDSLKERLRLNEECIRAFGPPIQIAFEGGHHFKDIEEALMECDSIKGYMAKLFRDRQVYVDAANAILVGAALIASVTFASWLQPPLNYTSYSGEGYSSSIPNPSTTNINYVDVEHNNALRAFWIFNALSFYFAIATVVCGARSVLPRSHLFIKKIVEKLRTNLLVTSILLAFSVLFVIIAFALAGTIVLTPLLKYQWYMIVPTMVGGLVCIISLVFLVKSMIEDEFKTSMHNLDYIAEYNRMPEIFEFTGGPPP